MREGVIASIMKICLFQLNLKGDIFLSDIFLLANLKQEDVGQENRGG
jgi:hypothetical protein